MNNYKYSVRDCERQRQELKTERTSFETHWQEIADYILPRRVRFNKSQANKGYKVNQKIINNTGTLAARTGKAGMMSGVTNPARPWFKLAFEKKELNEQHGPKVWAHEVTERMRNVFSQSNLYNVLPIAYGDVLDFATSAVFMERDPETLVRFFPMPLGTYVISNDANLKVNTIMREFRMTVRQLVEKFADKDANGQVKSWNNFSEWVRSAWENKNGLEKWVDVVHAIKPNPHYKRGSKIGWEKKYISLYYECGGEGIEAGNAYSIGGANDDRFLMIDGYEYFPAYCPRWEITGEDAYGTSCPGMDALGDIKSLQVLEKRKAQAVELMLFPTMVASSKLKGKKKSMLPGDYVYDDSPAGQRFSAAYEVRFSIQEAMLDIEAHESRIRKTFFEDLFLMLANSDRRDITATEVEKRYEEKLLALGPVLEQLNQDLLDPLIDNTYYEMNEAGMLPPPPAGIEDEELKIEYVSIMAQALKLVTVGQLERVTQFIIGLSQSKPEALLKLDVMSLIDEYADVVGVAPQIIKGTKEVEEILAAQQAAVQQAQQAQQIEQASSVAKNLGTTPIEEDNALGKILQFAG